MAKDPAFLIYYKDVLVSCADWEADVLGWYMRLLCHQADKPEGLPADIESLAALAGVKFSQYDRFVSCWKHTLVAKFEANANGLLINIKQDELLNSRREYKDNQAKRGLVGAFIKKVRRHQFLPEDKIPDFVPHLFEAISLDNTKEENEMAFKHTLHAYKGDANGNGNTDLKFKKEEPEVFAETIVGQMLTVWSNACPSSASVVSEDSQAMFSIGDFIALQEKISWLPDNEEQERFLVKRWQALANWISQDDFYKSWSLGQIATTKNLQTIWNKSKQHINGTDKKNNGKISTGKPVAGYVPEGGHGFNAGR